MRSGGPRARALALAGDSDVEPVTAGLQSLDSGAVAVVSAPPSSSIGVDSTPVLSDPVGRVRAASPSPKASALVAVGVAPKSRARPQPIRFYVCTRAPLGRGDLLGLHVRTWADIAARLPTGQLAGSGCAVAGFDSEAEAINHWVARGWDLPCPLR